MTTIRVKKDARYFSSSNEPFNDERLSWEARGLMGYLLSKPNDWVIRQADLEKQGPAGDHKLRRMLAELRKYGYMNRIRIAMPDGTFDWETEIYESPSQNPNPNEKITTRRFSTSGSSTRGKPTDIVSTEEEGDVFEAFQNNITPLTPMLGEELGDLIDEHSPHWVIEAIKEAALNGKRNIKYIAAILKRWKVDGYGTPHPKQKQKEEQEKTPRYHKKIEPKERHGIPNPGPRPNIPKAG